MNDGTGTKGEINIDGVKIGNVVSFAIEHHKHGVTPPFLRWSTGRVRLKFDKTNKQQILTLQGSKMTYEFHFKDGEIENGTAHIINVHDETETNDLDCDVSFKVIEDTVENNNKDDDLIEQLIEVF